MNRQELIRNLESKQIKENVADVRVGDSVKVHYKIREGNKERVQVFEGLVIGSKSGKTIQGSFTVRKVVSGVGVERTFPLHSPWIIKIERTKTGKVRRAKLNFVRRYALSSRFKLKDKGVAGTVWEEVAKEKEEIAEAKVEQAQEPVVEEEVSDQPVATEEQEGQAVADDNDKQDSEEQGGDSGDGSAEEEKAPDSKAESSN